MTAGNTKDNSGKLKLILLALAVVALLAAARYFRIDQLLNEAIHYIGGLGPLGILLYILIYVGACVFLVPGSVLTLGAGVIWGVGMGTVVVSISSTLGAAAAFLVGRYLARNWVSARLEGMPRFAAVDKAVAREGWKIVGLTRLSPIFPFNLLNYAFGLTKVSLRDYFFASWVGMLPGTVMFVYLGAVAGDLATVAAEGAGGSEKSSAEWAMLLVGLAATILVTIFITKIAKIALSERMTEEPGDGDKDASA